jgi:SAM-dependent methyltransferase
MCNQACVDFGIANLRKEEVCGKQVIEVGSLDVNGSLRSFVEKFVPQRYIGVDIGHGPGVDITCDATEIVERFGSEAFDVVISTEVLEHIRDWRKVIANFKTILKPGGVLLITTRSRGYGYHGFPFDYWRYEPEDMRAIFSDCNVEAVDRDNLVPGVFVKVRKPDDFTENNLTDYRLYSIIKRKRCCDIGGTNIFLFKIAYPVIIAARNLASKILPDTVKKTVKSGLRKTGWLKTE